MQRTTFESILTKGEIAQSKQFLLLSQCFNFFSTIIPSIIDILQYLNRHFQSSAAEILYVGKG